MAARLVELRRSFAREARVYKLVLQHKRTPAPARVLLGLALAYALSPIDLIPDGIPLLGHLDDVIIVPALIWLSLRLVPRDVMVECRKAAGDRDHERAQEP